MRQSEGAVVMKYINQLEHRDIPYEHNSRTTAECRRRSGMWLQQAADRYLCMMVDALTLSTYELTDCLKLSNEVGANREIGTSLKILGPSRWVERFNFELWGNGVDLNRTEGAPGKRRTPPSQIPAGTGRVRARVFTLGGGYILVIPGSVFTSRRHFTGSGSYKREEYRGAGRERREA